MLASKAAHAVQKLFARFAYLKHARRAHDAGNKEDDHNDTLTEDNGNENTIRGWR